uniref:Uncharacterized protein n=1 Tax=Rhizophagus irregularis (strain DAOM 181602 / DAOM 197198 / MUCL 43194) TaxID=747089 RepID=U9U8B1_RHIID
MQLKKEWNNRINGKNMTQRSIFDKEIMNVLFDDFSARCNDDNKIILVLHIDIGGLGYFALNAKSERFS